MEQILTSFIESLKERLKNPFMGTFLIIFFTWNWRAVLFLFFSDTDMSIKLNEYENYMFQYWGITEMYPRTKYIAYIFNCLIPVGLALVYLKFMPAFLHWIDTQTKFIIDVRKNWKNQIIIDDLRRKEEVLRAGRMLEVERKKFEEETDRSADEFIEEQEYKLEAKDVESKREISSPKLSTTKSHAEILFKKLEDMGYLDKYLKAGRDINKKKQLSNHNPTTDYFAQQGLIKMTLGYGHDEFGTYELTKDGEEVLRLARLK